MHPPGRLTKKLKRKGKWHSLAHFVVQKTMRSSWILVAIFIFSSVQANPQRTKRQNCDCTPGEAPKCGCQVMPTPEIGGGQMICTCSPPVPPKCVCTEGNVRNIITGPSLPALFKPYNCVSTCESSCLDSCNRLNFNMKCGTVCNEACQFTCAKQESTTTPTTTPAPATTVMIPLPPHIQEYRFVIPAGSLQTNPTTTTSAPVILSQKIQITCPTECQPACSFVCTKLRPTLKVITQMFDSKTDESTCKTSCSNACMSVCASSGVPGTECQSNCAPACEDTCTIVKPVAVATTQIQPTSSTGGQCVSVCMPSCTQQCMFTVQMQIALAQATAAPTTTERPAQAVLIPIPPVKIVVSDPTTTTTAAPAIITLGTICRNECLVQCEHQCLPNNPNCMAACQTTCYPVCQSKMRRRMKETKSERLVGDFALHHRQ